MQNKELGHHPRSMSGTMPSTRGAILRQRGQRDEGTQAYITEEKA